MSAGQRTFRSSLLPRNRFRHFRRGLTIPHGDQTALCDLYTFTTTTYVTLLFLFGLPNNAPLPVRPERIIANRRTYRIGRRVRRLHLCCGVRVDSVVSRVRTVCGLRQAPKARRLLGRAGHILASGCVFRRAILPALPYSGTNLCTVGLRCDADLRDLGVVLGRVRGVRSFGEGDGRWAHWSARGAVCRRVGATCRRAGGKRSYFLQTNLLVLLILFYDMSN